MRGPSEWAPLARARALVLSVFGGGIPRSFPLIVRSSLFTSLSLSLSHAVVQRTDDRAKAVEKERGALYRCTGIIRTARGRRMRIVGERKQRKATVDEMSQG